ncbi:MAG: alpha/beta hydrolase [Chloroflexota bacterium]|nr:alpha/beta hydrolase [Chloroflexota bacterium]
MPLDPQARAFLDQMQAAGIRQAHELTVEEARAATLARVRLAGGAPIPVDRVEDRSIPGPDGEIPVRIFAPASDEPLPVLAYFHGGGWIRGSIETHEAACREIANQARILIVSVEYRLAPEAQFPAAAEDCYAATPWLADHASELGGDGSRLAVGGDSAGGNLAAAVTLMARDRGGPPIAFQVLIYPVVEANFDTRSYTENATGYMLTRRDMQYYWDLYVPNPADRSNPYAAPLVADPHGLPPALVVTAEYDPLRDEGDAYAAKLRAAGVPVEHAVYPGMIHGFFSGFAAFDQGKAAVAQAARALREALAGTVAGRA